MNDNFKSYYPVQNQIKQKQGLVARFGVSRIIIAAVTMFILFLCIICGCIVLVTGKTKKTPEAIETVELAESYPEYMTEILDEAYGYSITGTLKNVDLSAYVPSQLSAVFVPYSEYDIYACVFPEYIIVTFQAPSGSSETQGEVLSSLIVNENGYFWDMSKVCTVDERIKNIPDVQSRYLRIADDASFVFCGNGAVKTGEDITVFLKEYLLLVSTDAELASGEQSYSLRKTDVDASVLTNNSLLARILKDNDGLVVTSISMEGTTPTRIGNFAIQFGDALFQGRYEECNVVTAQNSPYYISEEQLNDFIVQVQVEYDAEIAAQEAQLSSEEAGDINEVESSEEQTAP